MYNTSLSGLAIFQISTPTELFQDSVDFIDPLYQSLYVFKSPANRGQR
jgi:hypothetical protein